MEVNIYKAQGHGEEIVEGVIVFIDQELPKQNERTLLSVLDEMFSDQAEKLESALWRSLPGGTYDRLCGLMLKRKASHFVVPLGGPK
jgi:hypothetical protein